MKIEDKNFSNSDDGNLKKLHQEYLSKQNYSIPKNLDISEISISQKALIKKYGFWMQALENETIKPYTVAQEHFLSVCLDDEQPKSEFEVAWMKLNSAINLMKQKSLDSLNKELKIKKIKQEINNRQEQLRKEIVEQRKKVTSNWTEKSKIEKTMSHITCPGCGGDGGAKGECFRCDGTGWI
jgi:uncharacterized protein YifE (UPF0438 family)